MQTEKKKRAIVAITGASGVIIGIRLLKILALDNAEVFCIVSDCASKIIQDETDFPDAKTALNSLLAEDQKQYLNSVKFYDEHNFYTPPASGSFYFDAMAIAPCSMKTLGKLAHGIADNLIVRAGEVALKERRRFVVCPRETPLALTHIKNMETLSLAGAVILPPMISFYNKPKTISDVADFLSARIAQSMGFNQSVFKEWGL